MRRPQSLWKKFPVQHSVVFHALPVVFLSQLVPFLPKELCFLSTVGSTCSLFPSSTGLERSQCPSRIMKCDENHDLSSLVSSIIVMASNLRAMASNLEAMFHVKEKQETFSTYTLQSHIVYWGGGFRGGVRYMCQSHENRLSKPLKLCVLMDKQAQSPTSEDKKTTTVCSLPLVVHQLGYSQKKQENRAQKRENWIVFYSPSIRSVYIPDHAWDHKLME